MNVLVTKNLTPRQQVLLKEHQVTEIPFIEIELLQGLEISEKIPVAVFTSINAVKSVFDVNQIQSSFFEKIYCVGQKTKEYIESKGLFVNDVANNAYDLAQLLVNVKEHCVFFSGNLRGDELPQILADNGVMVTEMIVYETKILSKKVENNFDVVLFFSPSAVKGYVQAFNNLNTKVVCIGATTASEAVNYFEEVYIAESPTVEATITQLLEIIKN